MATRNPHIDTLRGISILLVVLRHLEIRIPAQKTFLGEVFPTWFLKGLMVSGHNAVVIFFVISGFLITLHSSNRWGSLGQVALRPFYVRRASRILPLLLALLAVLSTLHLGGFEHYVIWSQSQSLGGALVSALGLHLNWYEGQTGYLPASWDVLWSLSIEEAFYLGFPLACFALRKTWWIFVLSLAFAAALPYFKATTGGSEIWQDKAYLPGMSAIAMGVAAAILAREVSVPAVFEGVLRLAGGAGIALVLFAKKWMWAQLGYGADLVLVVSAAAFLIGSYQKTDEGPSRQLGWVRACGRLSYEIYLTHVFVLWWVVDFVRWVELGERWGFVAYIPAVGGAWILGHAIATWFTVPAERYLRKALIRPDSAPLGNALD